MILKYIFSVFFLCVLCFPVGLPLKHANKKKNKIKCCLEKWEIKILRGIFVAMEEKMRMWGYFHYFSSKKSQIAFTFFSFLFETVQTFLKNNLQFRKKRQWKTSVWQRNLENVFRGFGRVELAPISRITSEFFKLHLLHRSKT